MVVTEWGQNEWELLKGYEEILWCVGIIARTKKPDLTLRQQIPKVNTAKTKSTLIKHPINYAYHQYSQPIL